MEAMCRKRMNATSREQMIYGTNVEIVRRESDYTIYRMTDATGEGFLKSYHVFPGVELIYNDIHMQNIYVDTSPPHTMFEINHCREGRIECETCNGQYLYLAKGDLAINPKCRLKNSSSFPLNHYHGITIAIDIDRAKEPLFEILSDVDIDLPMLRQKFCENNECVILKENQDFEHIFAELYTVPDRIRTGYYKIKVLEILLFLIGLDLDEFKRTKRYYSKHQIDTIKAIEKYLTAHLAEKITIDQLSEWFHISLTTMKSAFKEVYGDSIYSYMKTYKMQHAAIRLKEEDKEISEVAGLVGYENASKFAAAFKDVIGMNPGEYKRMSKWSNDDKME